MPLYIHSVHHFIWYFHPLFILVLSTWTCPSELCWCLANLKFMHLHFYADYCLVFLSSVVLFLTVNTPILLFPSLLFCNFIVSVSIFKLLSQFSRISHGCFFVWHFPSWFFFAILGGDLWPNNSCHPLSKGSFSGELFYPSSLSMDIQPGYYRFL